MFVVTYDDACTAYLWVDAVKTVGEWAVALVARTPIAEEERVAAERETHAAAAAELNAAQEERFADEKAASDAARDIERKVARDARYAARKARK